jgi:hypothetical protein
MPAATRAYLRANLIAASLASVPLLQKKDLSANDRWTRRLASSTWGRRRGVGAGRRVGQARLS